MPCQLGNYSDFDNSDLLMEIGELAGKILDSQKVFVVKVRAHSGNTMNDLADTLAKAACEQDSTTPETTSNYTKTPARQLTDVTERKHTFRNKNTCLHKCCKRHLNSQGE